MQKNPKKCIQNALNRKFNIDEYKYTTVLHQICKKATDEDYLHKILNEYCKYVGSDCSYGSAFLRNLKALDSEWKHPKELLESDALRESFDKFLREFKSKAHFTIQNYFMWALEKVAFQICITAVVITIIYAIQNVASLFLEGNSTSNSLVLKT